jgi:hypothetical protein
MTTLACGLETAREQNGYELLSDKTHAEEDQDIGRVPSDHLQVVPEAVIA